MVVHALKISYRGTAYQGWQLQPGLATIQGELERALGAELGTALRVTGASRTDAGVHARGQVATLRLDSEVAIGRLVHGVNRRLPDDIRVLEGWIATPDFHPRFDACWKEYHYCVEHRAVLSPLDSDRVLAVPEGVILDLDQLERATAALVGEHDFAAFALVGGAHTTSRRHLFDARWVIDGPRLTLILRGNGFLRGMVRSIVGTLLEVARGRRSVAGFIELLAGADRSAAGRTAPPHGLCLMEVGYGEGLGS